jgi:hypothetical protein
MEEIRNMASKDCDQQGQDHRDLWERPTFRRLVTEDAKGMGAFQSEGIPGAGQDCVPAPAHSCKQ